MKWPCIGKVGTRNEGCRAIETILEWLACHGIVWNGDIADVAIADEIRSLAKQLIAKLA